MVGDFGEVQVMDWGLAIDVSQKPQTECKAVSVMNIRGPAGTPAYLAPEMALGEKDKIDARTDVYLLGAILYELLTGHPPHTGKSIDQVLLSAALNKVQPAHDAVPSAPEGLSRIAMKAMATSPADRYPDAPAFQNAIREYLKHAQSIRISDSALKRLDSLAASKQTAAKTSGQYVKYAEIVAMFRQALEMWPENDAAKAGLRRGLIEFIDAALAGDDLGLARAQLDELKANGGDLAPDYIERLKRWEKMNRAAAARRRNFRLAVGSAALLLVALIGGGAYYNVKVRNEKEIAERERERAETNEKEAVKQKQLAEDNEKEALKQKGLAEDNFKIAESERTKAENNFRDAETQRALAQKNYEEAEEQRKEADTQRKAAEENFKLAEEQRGIADEKRQEAEAQKRIAEEQRVLAETNEKEALRQKKLAEENEKEALVQKRLAEENLKKAIINLAQIDIQRAEALIEADRDYPRAAAHLVKAIGIMDGLDTTAPRQLMDQAFQFSPQLVKTIALNAPAKQLAYTGDDIESLRILYANGTVGAVGSRPKKPAGAKLNVKSFVYRNSQSVVCARAGELLSGGVPLILDGLNGHGVISLAVNASGERLAVGTLDGFLAVYQTAGQPPVYQARGHLSGIDFIAFRPGGNEVITSGADGRVSVWDMSSRSTSPARSVRAHSGYISFMAVSPDGSLIATSGDEGAVRLWNAQTLTERAALAGHTRDVGALAFHPVRPWLASHGWDGTLRLWDYSNLISPKLAVLHVPNSSDGLSVAFASSGSQMACIADGDQLKIWELTFFKDSTPKAWRTIIANGSKLLPLGNDGLLVAGGAKPVRLTSAGLADAVDTDRSALLIQSLSDSAGSFDVQINASGGLIVDGVPSAGTEKLIIRAAAASQRSAVIATTTGEILLVEFANRAPTLKPIATLSDAIGVAITLDGRYSAVWNAQSALAGPVAGKMAALQLPAGEKIISAVLSPDGSQLLYLSGNNLLNRYDLTQNCPSDAFKGHDSPITSLASDPYGHWLLTGDLSGLIRLWHPASGRSLAMVEPAGSAVNAISFVSGSRAFSILTASGKALRFSLTMPAESAEIEMLKDLVQKRLDVAVASSTEK